MLARLACCRSYCSRASLRWRSFFPATPVVLPRQWCHVLISETSRIVPGRCRLRRLCYRFVALADRSVACTSSARPNHCASPRGGWPVLIAGFPAGSFAANCYVVAPGPGEECVIIDPGQDAEPGIDGDPRRAPAQAGGGRWSPTATSTTSGRWRRCAAPGTSPPTSTRPTGRCSPTPPGGFACRPASSCSAGLTFTEPDDVVELADGMTLRLAGVELVVDHAPGHTPGLGDVPGGAGRDVLGRPAVRRLDRPDRPARRRLPDHPGQPGAGVPDRCRTTSRCCPGTGRRRPSAPSGPATRSWPASPPAGPGPLTGPGRARARRPSAAAAPDRAAGL